MLRDALRDTWAYQEMMKEAREEGFREGFEKGFQEGLEKGRREGLRQVLIADVRERFPKLARLTKAMADLIEDPDALSKFIQKMAVAQSIEEAWAALVEISAEDSSN